MDLGQDPEVFLDDEAPKKKLRIESGDDRIVFIQEQQSTTPVPTSTTTESNPVPVTEDEPSTISVVPCASSTDVGLPTDGFLSIPVTAKDPTGSLVTSEHYGSIVSPFPDISEEPALSSTLDENTPTDSAISAKTPFPPEVPGQTESAKVPEVLAALSSAPLTSSASSADRTPQERAKELLIFCVMPFCAPARRDWSKGGLLSIEANGKELSCPPLDWTKMTSDQRLLSVDCIAM